jgi:hypothetical protein
MIPLWIMTPLFIMLLTLASRDHVAYVFIRVFGTNLPLASNNDGRVP